MYTFEECLVKVSNSLWIAHTTRQYELLLAGQVPQGRVCDPPEWKYTRQVHTNLLTKEHQRLTDIYLGCVKTTTSLCQRRLEKQLHLHALKRAQTRHASCIRLQALIRRFLARCRVGKLIKFRECRRYIDRSVVSAVSNYLTRLRRQEHELFIDHCIRTAEKRYIKNLKCP